MKLTASQKHALVILVGVFLVIVGADTLKALLYPPQTVDFSALQIAFQERHQQILDRVPHAPLPPVTSTTADYQAASLYAGQASANAEDTLTEKVSINTATLEQLQRLPRIGPAIATRILRYRTEYGPYLTIEDLKNVKGIGPKIFETIRPFVMVKP